MRSFARWLAAPFAALALGLILLGAGHAQAPSQRAAVLSQAYDVDTRAWRDTIVSDGGTASAAQLVRVDRLVRGLKADGYWPDRIWLFASESTVQARRDLVARSQASAVNGPGFTVNRGYAGDGLAAYVNLGVAPSGLAKASHNSITMGFYLTATGGSTDTYLGSNNGAGSTFFGTASANRIFVALNSSGQGPVTGAPTGTGFFLVDRPDSATIAASVNGVEATGFADASTGVSGANLFALAENNNGSARFYTNARMGVVWVGPSLGVAGRHAVTARVNAYMAALGAATF